MKQKTIVCSETSFVKQMNAMSSIGSSTQKLKYPVFGKNDRIVKK